MAFNAGAIFGTAKLNTARWTGGLAKLRRTTKIAGAAIAATFVATMVKSIKTANEYQKALSNVATLVDTSQVSMVKMSRAILRLNPALGNATDLTKGMYQAFSAGAEDMDEALEVTKNAAMFAKAALTDTFTAVDVLTTAVNAYGKEAMDTKKASDLFFTTIKEGKLTGEDLASSIGQSIPLFASAGIELEQLASGMAAMTKQGVNAANATTQLNGIVNSFLKPQEALNNLIEEYGYESGAALLESEGLAGALRMIEQETKGDAAAMAELLPNIRALRGAMALTGVGGQEFNEILGEMEDVAGATAEAFGKQEKSFETFKNSANQVLTLVGNIGKGLLDELIGPLTTATQKWKEFLLTDKAMFIFAQIAGYVAASFAAIKGSVTILWDVLKSSLQPIIDVMSETFSEIFGMFADEGITGTTILAGAMRALGIAIAIPVAAISTVINLITTLVKSAALGAQSVGNFIKVLSREMTFKEFQAEAIGVQEEVGQLWNEFGQDTEKVWSGIIGNVKTFGEEVKQDSEKLSADISINYQKGFGFIVENYDRWISGAKEGNESLLDNTKETNDEATSDLEEQLNERLGLLETEEDYEAKIAQRRLTAKEAEMTLWEQALEEYYARQEEKKQEDLEKWREHFTERLNVVQSFYDLASSVISFGLSAWRDLTNQYFQNRFASIDNWYNAELEALDARLEQGIITEEEYNDRKNRLEEDKTAKVNKEAKAQFQTQQGLKIAQAWMDAGAAIMGWWAQAPLLGPIAGPIFASVMTGLTSAAAIAQTAMIASQEFVPAKAMGGRTAGGNIMMNELGPEITRLPGGFLIIPNQLSEQIAANSGGGFYGTINIYDPQVRNEEDIDLLVEKIVVRLGTEMRIA